MTDRKLSSRPSARTMLTDATGVADVVKDIRGKAGKQATILTHTLAQTLREHSRTLVDEQKSRAAEEIQHLGVAIRGAADQLHGQKSESLARYIDTAADGLDGFARYVEDMNFADLARKVEQYARRRPGLLLGGIFLVGLGVARFVKAGQEPASSQRRQRAGSQSNVRRSSGRRRGSKSRSSIND